MEEAVYGGQGCSRVVMPKMAVIKGCFMNFMGIFTTPTFVILDV
jgi:hypothetical protein